MGLFDIFRRPKSNPPADLSLVDLCINKALAAKNLGDNRAAVGLYDRAIEILERLVNVDGRRELANDLATVYGNKAISVGDLGDNRAAVGLYDRAIEIRERLVNVDGRRELADDLGGLYGYKAMTLLNLGEDSAAVGLFDRSIEILMPLVNAEGRRELANNFAKEARNTMAVLRAEINRPTRQT